MSIASQVETKLLKKTSVWSIGLAMFAMFFGAGNIVFPLAVGQLTQDKNFYGVMGMLITAVIVPLTGLLAMILYEGDYAAFFKRIGRLPGFILTLMILGLIGPFAGIPRCITISFSTLNTFGLSHVPGFSLTSFSLLSCALIFLFTFRPNKMIPLLGYVLTPLLLFALALIAIKGLYSMPGAESSTISAGATFLQGLLAGYNTMDLLACFFFSSVVLLCLRGGKERDTTMPIQENRAMLRVAVFGSIIAAVLLSLVYVSFSYLAAGSSASLANVPKGELLGTLAFTHLGPYAGLVAGTAVAFACLTTEIALTAILAEFVRKSLFKDKIRYEWALLLILGLSFLVSTLHFDGISKFLGPVLEMCYPALIVLTVLNIAYKLFNFKPVKAFVYATFLISVVSYFVS